MSNYTEADVQQWRSQAEAVKAHHVCDCKGCVALESLEAAALEGLKVAPLVADNAALYLRLTRLLMFPDASSRQGGEERALSRDVIFVQHGSAGAALLAEHEAKVSALQARVSELTAERDAARRWEETHRKASQGWEDMFNATLAERDARRAQVVDLTRRVGALGFCLLRDGGIVGTPVVREEVFGHINGIINSVSVSVSVSAPPDETTLDWRNPGDLHSIVSLCLRPDTDTIVRAYTEGDNTFEFDSSDLATLARPPAETTPAPARVNLCPVNPAHGEGCTCASE